MTAAAAASASAGVTRCGPPSPDMRARLRALRDDCAEVARVRGHGGGATWRWWANLDERMRCILLTAVCADDEWARYMDVPWQSLTDAMRSAIVVEVRSMVRALEPGRLG